MGVRVADVVDISVYTDIVWKSELAEDMTKVAYQPLEEGCHTVTVFYAGQEINKYFVIVGPYKETDVVCSGSGITNGIVGKPSVFKVKSTKGTISRLYASQFC